MWVYPWDLHAEGTPETVRAISRMGMTDLSVAMAYHAGMFLLPHNPGCRLYFPDDGTVYFRPDYDRYGRIRPVMNKLVEDEDVLASTCEEGSKRGIGVAAWLVCCHNTALGQLYPDCVTRTAFDDLIYPAPCPANPDVQTYLTALVADVTHRYELTAIDLESANYLQLPHGYHHEVYGMTLPPYISFLLGLCFCPSCQKEGEANGIDVHRLKSFVRAQTEDFFTTYPHAERIRESPSWEMIRQGAHGDMGAYLDVRASIVSGLVTSLREAALNENGSVEVRAIDFGPLYPMGSDGVGWQDGTVPGALKDVVLEPCLYFKDSTAIGQQLRSYQGLAQNPVMAGIRAISPQVSNESELRSAISAVENQVGLEGIAIYNYGFMAPSMLKTLAECLS